MLLVKNKKALFEYEVIERYTAGIVLTGHEVKAARERKVSFEGSFVKFLGGKPCVVGMHIGRYSKQSQNPESLDTRETRPLLLTKSEIAKISRELNEKGKAAIPLALTLENNLIKLEFAIAKGRKKYEKKALVRERQIAQDFEKAKKDLVRSF